MTTSPERELQFLKAALASSEQSIVIKDIFGTILYASQPIADFYQCTLAELLQKNSYHLLPSHVAAQVEAAEKQVVETGVAVSGREEWDLMDRHISMMVSRSPIKDENGKVNGIVSVYNDITELDQVIHTARCNQERFRVLSDTCPVGIFECDKRGTLLYANHAWEAITEIPGHSTERTEWLKCFHPDDCTKLLSFLQSTHEISEGSMHWSARLEYPDGRFKLVEVYVTPTSDSPGSIRSHIGSMVDMTEQKAMEESLREVNDRLEQRVGERTAALRNAYEHLRSEIASRQKAQELLEENRAKIAHVSRVSTMGLLAAELAHELNQPLYAIQNYVSGLTSASALVHLPHDLHRVFGFMSDEIGRAARIVRRTRDFLSPIANQLSKVDLNQTAVDAVEMLLPEAHRRGMKIELIESSKELVCVGDSIRLQQVLINLLMNSLDAMANQLKSDKIATLELTKGKSAITVTCYDTGTGVPSEIQPRLFETFLTTKSTGLGMGLAISRSIIEEHGGELNYLPNSSRGTAFRFSLPLVNGTHRNHLFQKHLPLASPPFHS